MREEAEARPRQYLKEISRQRSEHSRQINIEELFCAVSGMAARSQYK